MILDAELEPTSPGLKNLAEVAESAEAAATANGVASFFQALRASDLVFLPKHHAADSVGLFRATVAVAHRLGERSPALALGVSQHLASVWAFELTRPLTSRGDRLSESVGNFLTEVYDRRQLIANTTSHAGGNRIGAHGSLISRSGNSYVVEGWSTYMSLATEADKITFLTRDADGTAVGVITNLVGNPGLKVSDDLLFGEHLVLADTRRLRFDNLVVAERDVVGPDPRLDTFYLVQLICQNLCVAALNLGGAHRILEETKAFGLDTVLPSGSTLTESGSFSADLGRLALAYFTGLQLLLSCGPALQEVHAAGPTAEESVRALRKVTAVKHDVARSVEGIVRECRKMVGARSFMGGHPISRIGGEVLFGALGPMTEKGIEREFGEWYLGA